MAPNTLGRQGLGLLPGTIAVVRWAGISEPE